MCLPQGLVNCFLNLFNQPFVHSSPPWRLGEIELPNNLLWAHRSRCCTCENQHTSFPLLRLAKLTLQRPGKVYADLLERTTDFSTKLW